MHRYCKLMVISVVLLAACSDQTWNRIVECEGSIALCTFQEIIPSILRSQPSTPLDTQPFSIDFIEERYGVEEINCSHPLLSDNSEFVRIAELSPERDIKIWYSREELEEYDTETAWECANGESFTEYEKGTPRSTSEFLIIDATVQYGIVEGTVTDPEMLKQLEALWRNCEVGTEPPNFTGVFKSSIGDLPPEALTFCVTLDILPGAEQCFRRTTSIERRREDGTLYYEALQPESIEYSSHNGEIGPIEQMVSEADYCRIKGNSDSQARRIKIF